MPTAKQEAANRELARRNLKDFIQYTFPRYNLYDHSELICDAVDLLVDRIIFRLMLYIHPRSGKSEIVSRRLPAYNLGRFPDEEVMICSYNSDLAESFGQAARDILDGARFQNVFGVNSIVDPPVQLSSKRRNRAEWKIEGRRGGCKSAGVMTGIGGFGFSLGIIDDPVKDDMEAQSELIQERLEEWYWSAFFNRQQPGSRILLTMTRWHHTDLAGRLLQKQAKNGDFWYLLRLPALAETPDETRQFCSENWVYPELLLNKERIQELREMPEHERPHVKLWAEHARS